MLFAALLAGCASTTAGGDAGNGEARTGDAEVLSAQNGTQDGEAMDDYDDYDDYDDISDPLEPFNRSVYAFNDALDKALLAPVARGYERVVPGPGREMIGNFFGNLGDVWTAFNQLLQGKPGAAASDIWRVAINTSFGFFGIADVASEIGIEKHDEDFGQTLAVWGVPAGPYLVLPLLGPSTFRDAPGRAVDVYGDALQLTDNGRRNNLWLIRTLDNRARLFPAERLMRGAALDEYSFTRDAWLQRRRNQVYDGNPPSPYGDE